MKDIFLTALTAALLIAMPSHAQERLDLEGATITGNQELPKVLYIVPWKDSTADMSNDLPLHVTDDSLSAIDRDVFLRQLKYFDALHGTP